MFDLYYEKPAGGGVFVYRAINEADALVVARFHSLRSDLPILIYENLDGALLYKFHCGRIVTVRHPYGDRPARPESSANRDQPTSLAIQFVARAL